MCYCLEPCTAEQEPLAGLRVLQLTADNTFRVGAISAHPREKKSATS